MTTKGTILNTYSHTLHRNLNKICTINCKMVAVAPINIEP